MAHGRGYFKDSNGTTYNGDWERDMKHGKGIETWIDGSSYNGLYN